MSLACFLSWATASATEFQRWSALPPIETTLPTLSGEPMRPGAIMGRVTLVHFFATWCAPCKEELASLDALAGTLAQRPFSIVAVDVGEPAARVRRFFEQSPVRFPVLLDEERKVMKAWQVETFPTSYLVGADGKSLFKLEGELAWNTPEVITRIEAMMPTSPSKGSDPAPKTTQR